MRDILHEPRNLSTALNVYLQKLNRNHFGMLSERIAVMDDEPRVEIPIEFSRLKN